MCKKDKFVNKKRPKGKCLCLWALREQGFIISHTIHFIVF